MLRPGGVLVTIAISRYAWLLDGLASGRVFTRADALPRAVQGIDNGADDEPRP